MVALIVVCVVVGIYVGYRVGREKKDILFNTFIGALIGMAGGLLLVVLFSVAPLTQKFEHLNTRTDLVADNSNELQGSFFVVSGSIGVEQYYKFYFKTPDGGKRFGKLPAESVTIYEEDRDGAYIVKTGGRDEYSDRIHFWLIPRFLVSGCSRQGLYAIHVPKGTIKR